METGLAGDGLDGLGEQAWSVLDDLARSLHVKEARLQPTLDAIVSSAVETIDPAHYAGLIVLVQSVLTPQATAGDPPYALDLLQQRLGDGPCMQAARDQNVITVPDTKLETRWPGFGSSAAGLGVGSMLCVPLRVERRNLGALSLYAARPQAFTDYHLPLTRLFATHAALALGDAQRTEQLHTALDNRDLIGQAKGILIEREKVTPDEAFRLLSVSSQAANSKLVAVARHLVETGELLGKHPPA